MELNFVNNEPSWCLIISPEQMKGLQSYPADWLDRSGRIRMLDRPVEDFCHLQYASKLEKAG
jgi:hypothetical protein